MPVKFQVCGGKGTSEGKCLLQLFQKFKVQAFDPLNRATIQRKTILFCILY